MAALVDLCARRLCLLAVVLLLFSECMSDESLDLESSSQARAKRQIIDCRNKPEALRFRCGSGGCVDIDRVCDGREDCLDASDETVEQCSNNAPCPGLSFRCSYGACIDADLRCDGKRDCADGSDEHPRVCNPGHNKGNKGNKNPNKGQGNQGQGNQNFGSQNQGNLGFTNPGQGNQNFGGPGQGNQGFGSQGNNQGLANTVRPGLGLSNEQTGSGGCRTSEYRCTDGQCIDTTLVCDGNEDCRDKSDETYTQCYSVKCPSYSFRCAYGGCIDREGRCDGRRQCADGSDEEEAMCRGQASQGQTGGEGQTGGQAQWNTQRPVTRPTPRPRPTTNGQRPQTSQTPRPQVQSGSGCRLPQHGTGSSYVVNGCQRGDNSALCRGTPGTLAPESTSLIYTCNSGYSLVVENVNFTFCLNGKWNPEPPKCAKTCPALISNSVDLECTLDGKEVRCDKGQLPRTRATLKCKPSYRFPAGVTPDYNAVNCQQDGTWDWPLFKCIPDIRAILLIYSSDFKIGAKPVRVIPIDLFMEEERLAEKWNEVHGHLLGTVG